MKKIFITNGMARSGKDTFAKIMNDFVPTLKYSSIDYIKYIAKECGWNGEKDEVSRKFLSDLKMLTTRFNDLSFGKIQEQIINFYADTKHEVLLIDVREPAEIKKITDLYYGTKTILIRRDSVKNITSNDGDAGVYDYNYDFTIYNNGSIDEFRNTISEFVNKNIL